MSFTSGMTAEETLSAIQHHPAITKITRSYADGVLPATLNPYERIAQLGEALKTTTVHLIAAHSLLERGGKKAAASNKIFTIMLDDYAKAIEVGRAALAQSEPAPAPVESRDRDAYEGCREDLLDWKRRALVAEKRVLQLDQENDMLATALAKEVNGPTFMGEPAFDVQPAQEQTK